MGWVTKGSGKSYNSHVGFGQCVGCYSNKVVSSHIYCRSCRVCDIASRTQTNATDMMTVKKHTCMKNWEGSSKSMEAAAILHMVRDSTKRGFIVGSIVLDDDSVMRAHLWHLDPTNKKCAGKLQDSIYEPRFLADLTHQIKVVASHFYNLSNQPVSSSRVDKVMARRLKKY